MHKFCTECEKHFRGKDKQLIITEKSNCFHVTIHKDGSPLILGKGIVK